MWRTHQPHRIGHRESYQSGVFRVVRDMTVTELRQLLNPNDGRWRHVLNKRDPEMNTLLHYAAERGQNDMIKYIFETFGSHVVKNLVNGDGKTPKDLAANPTTAELFDPPPGEMEDTRMTFQFAESGDLSGMKKMTQRNSMLFSVENEAKDTLLHVAIANGHLQAVKWLMKSADLIQKENESSKTPIFLVAESGRKELVDIFLKRLASKTASLRRSVLNHVDSAGNTVFHAALLVKSTEFAHYFLSGTLKLMPQEHLPGTLNIVNELGNTVLHLAVRTGRRDIVLLLLRSGADDTIRDKDGLLPLEIMEIVTPYVSGVDSSLNIHQAILHDNGAAFEYLLERTEDLDTPNSAGLTPLFIAILNNNTKAALSLIKHGADVNYKVDGVFTAYEAAVYMDNEALFTEIGKLCESKDKSSSNSFFELLRRLSKEIHPLHNAVRKGDAILLRNMLRIKKDDIYFGEDISRLDGCGFAPIHLFTVNPSAEILDLLLKSGADIDIIDQNKSWTTLQYAAKNGHVLAVELLLSRGANPFKANSEDDTPVNLAAFNEDVRRLIQRSMEEKRAEIVDSFMKVTSSKSLAAFLKHWGLTGHILKMALGCPPLHMAALHGNTVLFSLLLEKTSDVNEDDGIHGTPLDIVLKKGNKDMVEMLLDLGMYRVREGRVDGVPDAELREILVNFVKEKISKIMTLYHQNELSRVKKLFSVGVNFRNIDFVYANDKTFSASPLHEVARRGDMSMLYLILEKGIDLEDLSIERLGGKTPLFLAVEANHDQMARELRAHGAELCCTVDMLGTLMKSKRVSDDLKVFAFAEFTAEVEQDTIYKSISADQSLSIFSQMAKFIDE